MNEIFKKTVLYIVDVDDLADFIEKHYNVCPEIEASLELGHDDSFQIDACADEYESDEFESYINNPQHDRTEVFMLMNKLSADGHIVDGTYLLKTY